MPAACNVHLKSMKHIKLKGVHRCGSKYEAAVFYGSKKHYLGLYASKTKAAAAVL